MKVVFILKDGEEKIVEAQTGSSLLDIISENNIPVIGVCGGAGVCASCRVKIDANSSTKIQDPKDQELDVLEMFQSDDGVRLACQVVLTNQSDGLRVSLL
jgi:2Fe-2S ferredoxin